MCFSALSIPIRKGVAAGLANRKARKYAISWGKGGSPEGSKPKVGLAPLLNNAFLATALVTFPDKNLGSDCQSSLAEFFPRW